MNDSQVVEYILRSSNCGDTEIVLDNNETYLRRLFGQLCSLGGEKKGPDRIRGLALVCTQEGRFEGASLPVKSIEQVQEHILTIRWQAGSIELESRWELDPESGVIQRSDSLHNPSNSPVTIYRCLARFPFPPAKYEWYRQSSQWVYENQGGWSGLDVGETKLRSEWGRTTNGASPFVCVREVGSKRSTGFHILPVGNWMIRADLRVAGQRMDPALLIEIGQEDEDLHLVVSPGSHTSLPQVLVQPVPEGEPYQSAHRLHKWAFHRLFAEAKCEPPVVYNTWFFQFDHLHVPSLRRQLLAAKDAGCDVFVIDAGWFGPDAPGWWQAAGDWREKTESSFFGKMAEFADEVRSAGLGFGLWMEPERFNRDVPVVHDHPQWFIPAVEQGLVRINLENEEAYHYLKKEIYRLVETYQLAWMKVDFNFELGFDPSGAELFHYAQLWYKLMDEIRKECPGTFFEGCSSGAMRLDLESLHHFDAHFLSDTVNPLDNIRIAEAARLRLPGGRLTQWVTLRSAGNGIPVYSDPMSADWPETLITPGGAGWTPSETVDLDFAFLAMMPGIPGFSGVLADLPAETRNRIAMWIRIYKQWRRFICRAAAYALTPPENVQNREGWSALQLQETLYETSLVFAYRLKRSSRIKQLHLRSLDPDASYRITCLNNDDAAPVVQQGSLLVQNGLSIELPGECNAALFVIERLK
jgi:alpha-galactosidase